MAIDKILNALSPILGIVGIVVGATLQYWISKRSEAQRNRQELLKLQITGLLLPLFIQFKMMDIENFPNIVYPDKKSMVDVFLKNTEIEKILTDKLYLASPDMSHHLLEFLHNTCTSTNVDGSGSREYRSTFLEGEDGGGVITEDEVLQNYEELKKAIYKEYDEKVRLYQKSFGEKEKKRSFLQSVIEKIKVRRRKPPKFKIHLNRR